MTKTDRFCTIAAVDDIEFKVMVTSETLQEFLDSLTAEQLQGVTEYYSKYLGSDWKEKLSSNGALPVVEGTKWGTTPIK